MNKELFFIPILGRALKSPDPNAALKNAFKEIKQFGSLKEYREGFKQFELFMDEAFTQHELIKAVPVIQIICNDCLVGEMTFTESSKTSSIANIVPGDYVLKLNIGRIIWKGELTPSELVWTEAFPQKKLELAAETAEMMREPSRKIVLWDGEIIIRTYAGIESGSIEVELTQ